MSCKAYFVKLRGKKDQQVLAQFLKFHQYETGPDSAWLNYLAKATRKFVDPLNRKPVEKFGYKEGDLVAAITADIGDFFESCCEAKIDSFYIPYYTRIDEHDRKEHEEGVGFIVDDFKALENSRKEYGTALISKKLIDAIGF
jgi:hypothetical protein